MPASKKLKEYSEDQKQIIRDMRNAGDSVDVIAAFLRTSKERVRRLLREEGLPTNVFRSSRPNLTTTNVINVEYPHMPYAACKGEDTSIFFNNAGSNMSKKELMESTKRAVEICISCKHRLQCLEYGLKAEPYGIWGGTTELERQYLRFKLGIKCARDVHSNGNRAMRPVESHATSSSVVVQAMDKRFMKSTVVREYLSVNE